MSISMKSLLTDYNDDNSEFWRYTENYIDQDHTYVNYQPGTGGEWLCGFLASHTELAALNSDMSPRRVNAQNRWRIKGSTISKISNQNRQHYWNEDYYDGTEQWHRTAIEKAIKWGEDDSYRRNLVYGMTNQTITRGHDAWNEIHVWPQQFRSFKVITLVNPPDSDTWPQVLSNIIKKIWFHEYPTYRDMHDELVNKFEQRARKHPFINEYEIDDMVKHLGEPYTWVKLEWTMAAAVNRWDYDEATKTILGKWKDWTGPQMMDKFLIPLPEDIPEFKFDLLAMLRDKDEDKYHELCDFMKITPHRTEQFQQLVEFYYKDDRDHFVTEDELRDVINGIEVYGRAFKPRTSRALL